MKNPIRRLFVVVLALLGGLLLMQNTAFAQDDVAPVAVEEAGSQFVISPIYWSIIAGLVLPFVIALLTKYNGNPTVKGIFGILAAAVSAIGIRAANDIGGGVLDQALLLDIFLVYGTQLLTYLGLWKNLDNKQGIGAKTMPEFGIG